MPFLHHLFARFRAWRTSWRYRNDVVIPLVVPMGSAIFREVTSQGVKVYSLCSSCGSRLETSATLCGACAQRRSPSSF